MLAFAPATPEQYADFLQMMWDDGQDYMEITLRVMQMTWEQYFQLFRTRGDVLVINQGADLVGFYWIEQRGDTLHLHGLILKPEFQAQGIGTTVLTMLEKQYAGKVDKIELGVYQENVGAKRLYEKMGFTIIKTLTDLPFHIMQKSLKPQFVS
jgi:ribosomal protein S18 acetylase RimI-like enzyme